MLTLVISRKLSAGGSVLAFERMTSDDLRDLFIDPKLELSSVKKDFTPWRDLRGLGFGLIIVTS